MQYNNQGHGRSTDGSSNPYAAGCEEVVYDADMDPPASPWLTAAEYQEITGDEYDAN